MDQTTEGDLVEVIAIAHNQRIWRVPNAITHALLVALFPLSACYTYAPTTAPPQATPVRLQLAEPGEFPLSNLTANHVVQMDSEVIPVAPISSPASATHHSVPPSRHILIVKDGVLL